MLIHSLTIVAAGLATIAISPSFSQAAESPVCGSRPDLLKQLSTRFHEQPVALGVTSTGSLIELLTTDNGTTWSLMISNPNGSSCLVAAGEGWEEIKPIAKGDRGA
jgi:hypothetical protein